MRCSTGGGTGRAVAFALLLTCGATGAAHAGGQLALRVGPHAFQVEVAATLQERQRGLMGRTHLAADGGMLFVFEQPGLHCFWMRDTPLPLSIAFIDAEGRIVNFSDMRPRSETQHCPRAPSRYALEVRQGEFQRRGIARGARVEGLPR